MCANLAIAAIRDMFLEAENVNSEIHRKYPWNFYVKAVMDLGRLRVFESAIDESHGVPQLNIEGLSDGSRNPFVSTERMKKFFEITDKSKNLLLAPEGIIFSAREVVANHLIVDKIIPDFNDTSKYSFITEYKSQVLSQNPPDVLLFRNHHSMVSIVQHIQNLLRINVDESVLNQWTATLRELRSFTPTAELGHLWTYILRLCFMLSKDGRNLTSTASFISLTPLFIPARSSTSELWSLMIEFIVHENPRIQANAIEIWSELSDDFTGLEKHLRSFKNNRSLANAILTLCRRGLHPRYLGLLRQMLSNKDPGMRAAGCYAFGQIIKAYQKKEPIVLRTNVDITKLALKIFDLENDRDEMVRRQARRAFELMDDELIEVFTQNRHTG